MKKYNELYTIKSLDFTVKNSIDVRVPLGETLGDVYNSWSYWKQTAFNEIYTNINNIRYGELYHKNGIDAFRLGITAANTMQYTYDWILKINDHYYLIRETRTNRYAKLLKDDELEKIIPYMF